MDENKLVLFSSSLYSKPLVHENEKTKLLCIIDLLFRSFAFLS